MAAVTVKAPPSKSLSHRVLIATALSRGDCEVENVLASDDIERTMDCLTRLGARFKERDGVLRLRGMLHYLDNDATRLV